MRAILVTLALLMQAQAFPSPYNGGEEAIPGQKCLVKWRVGNDIDVGPLVPAGVAQRYYDVLSSQGVRAYLECFDTEIA